MITAKQAKNAADDFNKSKKKEISLYHENEENLKRIMQEIKDAASEGEYEVTVEISSRYGFSDASFLSKNIVDYLKSFGYSARLIIPDYVPAGLVKISITWRS